MTVRGGWGWAAFKVGDLLKAPHTPKSLLQCFVGAVIQDLHERWPQIWQFPCKSLLPSKAIQGNRFTPSLLLLVEELAKFGNHTCLLFSRCLNNYLSNIKLWIFIQIIMNKYCTILQHLTESMTSWLCEFGQTPLKCLLFKFIYWKDFLLNTTLIHFSIVITARQ